MKVVKEKHPLVTRWTHWINFPILAIMTWSGMLIYWANDEYRITLFGHTFFRFFCRILACWLSILRATREISCNSIAEFGVSFPVHVVFYVERIFLRLIYRYLRRVEAIAPQPAFI